MGAIRTNVCYCHLHATIRLGERFAKSVFSLCSALGWSSHWNSTHLKHVSFSFRKCVRKYTLFSGSAKTYFLYTILLVYLSNRDENNEPLSRREFYVCWLLQTVISVLSCTEIAGFGAKFITFVFGRGTTKPHNCLFTGQRKPISWKNFIGLCFKYMRKHPFSEVTWYPDGKVTSSRIFNTINQIFLHWLPAYFLDSLVWFTGGKPM